jgi:hypothetical protein
VFKAIISRDNGEPWGETGMTSAKWLDVPTTPVRVRDLIATQPGVLLHALTEGEPPVGGDPHPHVIDWAGSLYLEDGHHRAVRALISGNDTITARVLRVGAEKSLGQIGLGGFAG